MLFTTKNVEVNPLLKLNGVCIGREKSFKYLGVTVDDCLEYGKHVDELCGRISRLCGVSFRLKKHLNLKSAKKRIFFVHNFHIDVLHMYLW